MDGKTYETILARLRGGRFDLRPYPGQTVTDNILEGITRRSVPPNIRPIEPV